MFEVDWRRLFTSPPIVAWSRVLCLAVCGLWSSAIAAKASEPPPPALTITKAAAVPKIDGVMTEGEWDGAAKCELKHQFQPQQLSAATEKTEVFLMFDKETLYVAFHAFDSNPAAVRAPVSKRDNIGQDDFVSLWLDTFDDRRALTPFVSTLWAFKRTASSPTPPRAI